MASFVVLALAMPALSPAAQPETVHWAFQRPVQPAPPKADAPWARNEIDAFVLEKLASHTIQPAPEADRRTLIRRVSLDLVGLPPTPAEVDAFLADDAPDAYERLVDRLLGSPHFGERQARHWLDLARYADSAGYESDLPRSVWRYRDWVIEAVNRDLPFDRFVVEQIAGDLLDGAAEHTIATGFHAGVMYDPGVRWEAVLDQVSTTGTVFLGLSVGCAQCHDHKWDPVTQREFYALYAFFDSASISPFELATVEEKAARDAARARLGALQRERTAYEAKLTETLGDWAGGLSSAELAQLPAPAQAALSTGGAAPSADKVSMLLAARTARDPHHQDLCRAIDERSKEVPVLETTLAMRTEPRETRRFERGNHEQPGDVVTPGVPAFLHPLGSTGRPTRLDLARWLVSADNPLVARVTVNRIWQQYFGAGLVETANDFGVQTPPPVHRELLDWLACEFVARGWSTKAVHRLIVCSATYRQSSHTRPELQAIDPTNRLLARGRRLRVEAEVIRDLALSAAGLLSPKLGGPSVFPFQPEGVLDGRATKATWTTSPGEDRYRRGLYTWTWRLTPHPTLVLFDAPDASMACTRRDRSNTPMQALTLLNDPTFVECARHLARRVVAHEAQDQRARLAWACQICLSRDPRPDEAEVLLALFETEKSQLQANVDEARQIAGDLSPEGDAVERAAWTVLCRTILSLDEFVTRE